jgi:hypothetical protein
MRRAFLVLTLLLMQGCVSVGSRTALVNQSVNAWTVEGREYRFDGKDLIVTIPDITIVERPRAVGLIVPIIPAREKSYEDQHLEVSATIIGFPSALEKLPSTISIEASIAGSPVPVESSNAGKVSESTTNNPQGRTWVQYAVRRRFGVRLGAVEDVVLHFDLPMFAARVPELRLVRKEISDNYVVLTPGP